MTTYKIQVFYETGDSFKHYDADCVLPMEWKSLDKAKAALKRVKEHYEWYSDKEGWRPKDVPEPEWHKGIEYDFCLKVLMDDDTEVQFHADWCGYFEKLYSAKIIVPPDDSMEVRFDA